LFKPGIERPLLRAQDPPNPARDGNNRRAPAGAAMKLAGGMPMRLLTLREVAHYLQVHPGTVYRLVKTRQLKAIRVGRDLRFDLRVVDSWVANGGSAAPPARSRKK